MNYTLRDPNGNVLLAVESTPVVTEADMKADLDSAAKACESAFDEVTKYQDAMAVMSTEGFGEQAKAVASKVWEKIKKFFIDVGKWIKNIVAIIKGKLVIIVNKIKGKSITSALLNIKQKYNASKKTTVESDTNVDKLSVAKLLTRFNSACKVFEDSFSKGVHSEQVDEVIDFINEVEQCADFNEMSHLLTRISHRVDAFESETNGALDAKYDVLNDEDLDLDAIIDDCINTVKDNNVEEIVKSSAKYIDKINNTMETLNRLCNIMVELSNAQLVQKDGATSLSGTNYVVDTDAVKLANLKCKAAAMCQRYTNRLLDSFSKLTTCANQVIEVSVRYSVEN